MLLLFAEFLGTSSHLNMSSTHDYNTRSNKMSDSKILVKISKLREELVENLKKASLMLKMK